jgi:hypothetical protein
MVVDNLLDPIRVGDATHTDLDAGLAGARNADRPNAKESLRKRL